MDELEATLNRVLSDPKEMEKLSRLAGELFGGTEARGQGEGTPDAAAVKQLLRSGGGGNDKSALINALLPYLRPERREKLKKAMRFTRAARVAGIAMAQFGGGENV